MSDVLDSTGTVTQTVPASIHTLPDELLLIIFDHAIANSESVHTRATLALVSQYWKDVIYATPALWTTLRTSVWCHRALLGLTNSQEMPIDVDMTVEDINDHQAKEALEEITKHLHRWRSATLRIPPEQRLFQAFFRPAPLLEHLYIDLSERRQPLHFDPFERHAPRLRSIYLYGVHLPWSTEMLSGLEAIELKGITTTAYPSAKQLTSILKASPRLSSLKLHTVHVAPLFDADSASPIHLPLLEVLEVGRVGATFVAHLLGRIKSASCSIINTYCTVKPGESHLFKSTSVVIPNLLPHITHTILTLWYEEMRYSLCGTPSQSISVILDGGEIQNLLDRLIQDTLPPAFLTLDMKLTLHVRPNTWAVARGWLETSDAFHVTDLTINAATDGVLDRLATPTGGRWLFPYLQSLTVTIGYVTPGTLAQMVKSRHQSEGPLPMPFTSISVSDTLPGHAPDRAFIESVIGPEGITWKTRQKEREEWLARIGRSTL